MDISQRSQQDLTVKGESVERVYGNYQERRYIVNRRYQRKLVWTLDEKKKFIDSIIHGYPVPIVLLAERRQAGPSLFEIIDGMQRLNAIVGFLENEFDVADVFFDLNTMASTKALLDNGSLLQKTPVLSREICIKIATYNIPLSIYEFSENQEVDEVFRRINSGGRKLSRQELRIAGATGHFAHLIRKVSAKIRGDVSSSDVLLLNEMKKISITNRELPYGINVDDIFWIKQGVLTKEQVRESRDEEIIADILSFVLLDPPRSSRTEFIDDYFGLGEGDASRQRFEEIETAVQKHTFEIISGDFQRVIDELKVILLRADLTLSILLFGSPRPRAPRYFQAIFLALYKLIVKENKEVANHDQLIALLKGCGDSINVPEGGKWKSKDRANAVNATAGMLSPAFRERQSYDPAKVRWVTQLENILTQSYTEQAAYDFKQGFVRLDSTKKFDDDSFQKILKTLSAIANIKPGEKGYVIVGIADNAKDAKRVQALFEVKPKIFERFFITGIEHEAVALDKNLDQLFQLVTEKVSQSLLSEPLRDYVARQLKMIRYYDKTVFVFETCAQREPSRYGDQYLVRYGNELKVITPDKFMDLYRRFQV
ncbi:MAG: DUF262 domain-containing protein [Deltaproteobacteria bacterium]|nr:DUF262 domain-containing protein [Deltaproteobacteria bacterium]